MSDSTKHVVIIGGGIAGPILALCLKKIGITATIYEAYPQIEDIGAGLQIAPNGMRIMATLGLAQTIIEKGSPCPEFCFFDQNGKKFARMKNGRVEKHGQIAVSIARSVFHQIVVDEAERQGIKLEYQKRLTQISYPTPQKVVAHFEDGSTAEGDMLVGADGIRSSTRAIILPDAPQPDYTGFWGVGGFVPRSIVPSISLVEQNNLNMVFGAKGFFGYSGSSPNEIMWWSNFESAKELSRKELASITTEEMRQKLFALHEGWQEPVLTILKRTPDIIKAPIYDNQALPTWHKGRVILIGDAAHAMTPTSGQGISMAIEDAIYLAKLLAQKNDSLEVIFNRFEQDRRPRVEKINAQARRYDNDKREVSPFAAWLRNRMMSVMMPLFGAKMLDWVHSYSIEWDTQSELVPAGLSQ